MNIDFDFQNKKYRIVTYEMDITTASSTQKLDLVLENDITKVVGLKLNAQIDVQAYNRGTISVDIDKTEIFPSKFEAKNIMAGLDCPPQDRFWVIERETKNKQITFEYTDNAHPSVTFSAGKVRFVLLCETII